MKKIQKLLCELLGESGDIILNNQSYCIDDRLKVYWEIVENMEQINDKITYIIYKTNNF